jgi:galactokinase
MPSLETLAGEAARLFRDHFGCAPALIAAAPGRANIIGEHTDYNDGHVLPVAIDRYLLAAAGPRTDSAFRLRSAALGESFEFDLDRLPAERPGWSSYIVGVAAEMRTDGLPVSGKDILLHGDLPIGSGLSSSAALEVSVATAIERLDAFHVGDAQLVAACRRADHRFVGVNSGPMDQFASRACRAGFAGLLDCRSLEMSHRPLPQGVEFLSVYSGVPRTLAGSEYNERQGACVRAVAALQRRYPHVRALRDADMGQLEALQSELDPRVYRRARHVISEQCRLFEVIDAFESGDIARAGSLLIEGHRSLAEDYEVSLPVLDEMVDWLCRQPGVAGVRLTGAGFGGSLICIARAGSVDAGEMAGRLREDFRDRTPELPALWKLRSVDGARYLPDLRP